MAKTSRKSPMPQYRQGDVFIERIADAPPDLTPIPPEGERVILAHGEVTGHSHALDKHAVRLYAAKSWADRVLVIARTTALLHEEHASVTLPPGNYRVSIQREYTPQEIRNVAD